MICNILVVDDDFNFCKSLERSLGGEFNVLIATDAQKAMELLGRADLVLLDIRLNKDDVENRDGIVLLSEFLEKRPELPVIMITAYGDVRTAVEAMKLGAVDFLEKPLELARLRASIDNALQRVRLLRRVKSLERELFSLEPVELIGESEKIKEIRQLIDHVAKDGRVTVLIQGETGTGKELVAKLIHRRGWRAGGPFVALSLVSFPPSLIESELFGYERGAFTGAVSRRIGHIEEADKGVLFLDDIDTIPLGLQPKLLRFLQEKCIYRINGKEPIFVDVQVIAATNRPLFELVQARKFRDDLYYRINTMTIDIPPLRERPEDIPLLCYHFLGIYQKQGRTNVKDIRSEVIDVLKRYEWPGNVRELRNVIERACIMAGFKRHEFIEIDDLPKEIVERKLGISRDNSVIFDIEREKARVELFYIERALEKAGGKKGEAYKILGLKNRFALRRKILGIRKKYPELLKEFPLASSFLERKRISSFDF